MEKGADDALFTTGTGLERVGVVGQDQDCRWAELEDAGSFWAGVGSLQCWSTGPGCGILLQKEP